MKATLIGIGCGGEGTLTLQGRDVLLRADYILGAERLLASLPEGCTQRREAAIRPEILRDRLAGSGAERPCVVYSGDSGFYSGARSLIPLLEEAGIEFQVLPGISSLQALAARLGRPWQDWALCSAHGISCDPVAAVCGGRPAFFLTGGRETPGTLCARLVQAGLGDLPVTVGENLSAGDESVRSGTASAFAGEQFSPLSVLLAEPAPRFARRTPGIPDDAFLREQVPMTKQEVRAAILAKLAVAPGDVCWDVGAGTGSVSVELALQAGEVWAAERDPAACGLIRANRERFGAWNLRLAEGSAPEALDGFPPPDKVFVGGSGGSLPAILEAIRAANPQARICVSAIALETLHTAMDTLEKLGYEAEAVQIAVSRTRSVGRLHLLAAQNPVFLITGEPR